MFTQMGTSGNLPFYFFFLLNIHTIYMLYTIVYIPVPTSLLFTLFFLTLDCPFLFFALLFYFFFLFPFDYLYFLYIFYLFFLYWTVSWCSWLSHHFYVVRVPGSNPGGTIFTFFLLLFLSRLLFSFFYFGRFISSRIHPFPSEHGSKDA